MRDMHEAELGIALAEGLISEEEAAILRAEAHRTGRSPLEVLRERSVISEGSLALLRDRAPRAAPMQPPEAMPVPGPELAPTLKVIPGQRPAPPPEAPAFPVQGWSRYRGVRFLGQGGMGRVFLAYDPQLRRNVALKFVRDDDPALTRRFLAEARAQARVSHERVCKVYEVGEIEGRIYIAMQYVEGPPLLDLARELSVEQKVLVLREAAEGVHEAHRAGLIHRDIKPSNILVERTDDGRLKPYVMDFGLARDWREGATATGAVLGTPQYMAPEQARGEVGRLDRRADVYSLGATLYHLLTGQYPIPGGNGLEVLNNIATEEPRPPRAVDPDIPPDLEAIVLKCLEKDRSARYDSARALIEDLDRFLAGEPVRARSGPWYRLRKRVRKHRLAVSLSAAALAALLLALGWAGLVRREAAQRERLARRFTEQVDRVEALARYSDLSRLHDTTADHKALQARMDELAAEIREGGELAAGPGHYALGRGFLALGEEDKAREYLDSAWRQGFREPRVAYALALVTGHVYQQQLQEAERLRDSGQREARKRELERHYRDPALAYLRQSQGAEVPSTEYVEALIAFYEGRLDDALARLDVLGHGLPWFYEAPQLRGDILLARASQRWNEGDRDGALADFESGRRAYAAAAAIGESVPAIYQARARLEYAALVMELYGQGDVMPPFTRGLEDVSLALRVAPGSYDARVQEALFYRRLAEFRANHGEDSEEILQKAMAAAQAALDLAPAQPEARLELGRGYWQRAQALQNLHRDPAQALRLALEIYEGIAPANRDDDFHLQVGLVHKTWADYQDWLGADSTSERGKSIESFLMAVGLSPRAPEAWINLATSYFLRASRPRAGDPDGDLARARDAFDKALALNPKLVVPYFYAGQLHELMGKRSRARGGDAGPELAAAVELYHKGLEINPRLPHLHNSLGLVLQEQAREAWDHGKEPDRLLAQARVEYEKAIESAPSQVFAYNNLGEAFLQGAFYARALREDPGPLAREAMMRFQEALARTPDYAAAWTNQGAVHALLAAAELERGRDPGVEVEEASKVLQRALKAKQTDAQAWRALGEALGVRARWRARTHQAKPGDFEEAARAFERALEFEPENPEGLVAYGHLCRDRAAWLRAAGQDAEPLLQRALGLAERALAAYPRWPDARLLRASVMSALADASPRADERKEYRSRAAEDFSGALATNPHLERAWRDLAAQAERLAAAPP